LELDHAQALVIAVGGAAHFSASQQGRLQSLLADGLVRVARDQRIATMDGGTDVGLPCLLGLGVERHGLGAPYIGVCPFGAVHLPESPPNGKPDLEPHHSHFVLTPGFEFGDETELYYALVSHIAERVPSLALVINGGDLSLTEVLHNATQGRPIIVCKGSGRAADRIAQAVEDGSPVDPQIARIVERADLVLFDVNGRPEELGALISETLWR
jgi:hypothetical protein